VDDVNFFARGCHGKTPKIFFAAFAAVISSLFAGQRGCLKVGGGIAQSQGSDRKSSKTQVAYIYGLFIVGRRCTIQVWRRKSRLNQCRFQPFFTAVPSKRKRFLRVCGHQRPTWFETATASNSFVEGSRIPSPRTKIYLYCDSPSARPSVDPSSFGAARPDNCTIA